MITNGECLQSLRQKHIMDLFMDDNANAEYFSFEVKSKISDKGFEGTVASLQMQTYLIIKDFSQRRNKQDEPYGWPIAIYCTPVYYAHPSGRIFDFLDRVFFSAGGNFKFKLGTTAALDALNKYFGISQMPIAGSTYWNNVHGLFAE